MDDIVRKAMARWPDVPAVYGWLGLDRRGRWTIKGEPIGNAIVRAFIDRNYLGDEQGRWYFQNGPQRVFVALAYTPLVVHFEAAALFDHCGGPFQLVEAFVDDEGSVLMLGKTGIGLLDDRDLAAYADRAQGLSAIDRLAAPGRFGFVTHPAP